jgi:DNA-directed RNA polymerase specialized sigma24 family protein
MHAEEYFATEWLAEVPRLRRMLARNGISIDTLDDVLQEAAIRLYSAWGRVFDDRPLRPLVNTIVLNAARDHHRRTHYEVRAVAEIPEAFAADPQSTERVALARVELARAGRALLALTEQQREVVVKAVADELAGEQNGRARAPAATRMAITRARRRLVEVLEVTAAAIGVGCALLRRGATARGARPTVALGLLALSASVLFGGGGSSAQNNAPAVSEQKATGTAAETVRSGVSQWQYSASLPALEVSAFAERFAGTSRWTWDTAPLLWAGAAGAQVRVGQDGYDASCALRVADRVEVRYRCLPLVAPASTSAGR